MENRKNNTAIIERRFFGGAEFRAQDGTDGFDFVGLASRTGVEYVMHEDRSEIWAEEISPKAFDKVLNNDVRVLINHDPNLVLGRTRSGTAKVWLEADGLRYGWHNPDTSYAKDLAVSLERGDIDQSSFGFISRNYQSTWDKITLEDGRTKYKRTINDFDEIFDVSAVTFPASNTTTVGKRDFRAAYEEFVKQKEEKPTPPADDAAQRAIDLEYEYLVLELTQKLR